MRPYITLLFIFISNLGWCASQYVVNLSKDEVVVDSGSQIVRPIASVTKLMTSLVVIDSGYDLEEKIPYKGYFRRQMSRNDLLSLMLVKSDNQAANALAGSLPGGRDNFIAEMNIKAISLGMSNTHYDDPSGLSAANISTARDLAILLNHAYDYYKIREITSTVSYSLSVEEKRKHKVVSRTVTINNTNRNLLSEYSEIRISKTGTTSAAGKCLAMLINRNGDKYAVIILGERNRKTVEKASRRLFNSI